ncbi:MAG: hypothetical protein NZM11_00920 [Anaerolineales bacterium]|nr:hypothetical protein [Anaerolineales bacterium]
MHVAVANGDGGEFDAHLARVRRIKANFFKNERFAELVANGGFDMLR